MFRSAGVSGSWGRLMYLSIMVSVDWSDLRFCVGPSDGGAVLEAREPRSVFGSCLFNLWIYQKLCREIV